LKIAQLNAVDSSVGIGTESVFPMVSGTSSANYQTSKVTSVDIAKFVLNPMPVGQAGMESIGFTGNANINFKKTNWIDASQSDVHNYPFLQVRKSDGLLVTGSGVAFDSATVPWNFIVSQDIKMQGYYLTGCYSFYFGSSDDIDFDARSFVTSDADGEAFQVKAYTDLTLSGNRHVSISGQALDLASTPISGDVTFTGGNVTIDPSHILYVNDISTYIGASSDDKAVLSISGAARFYTNLADAPDNISESVDIDWKDSNIQYDTINGNEDYHTLNYVFSNVRDGQTVTMYIENINATTTYTPTFTSGTPNTVLWGGTGGPRHIAPNRTNVYTFAAIHTGIFASAITGYEY